MTDLTYELWGFRLFLPSVAKTFDVPFRPADGPWTEADDRVGKWLELRNETKAKTDYSALVSDSLGNQFEIPVPGCDCYRDSYCQTCCLTYFMLAGESPLGVFQSQVALVLYLQNGHDWDGWETTGFLTIRLDTMTSYLSGDDDAQLSGLLEGGEWADRRVQLDSLVMGVSGDRLLGRLSCTLNSSLPDHETLPKAWALFTWSGSGWLAQDAAMGESAPSAWSFVAEDAIGTG